MPAVIPLLLSRTVTWTEDLTPPVFTGTYTDVTLGCNPTNIDATLGSATATDGCGAVTINFNVMVLSVLMDA